MDQTTLDLMRLGDAMAQAVRKGSYVDARDAADAWTSFVAGIKLRLLMLQVTLVLQPLLDALQQTAVTIRSLGSVLAAKMRKENSE